MFIGCDKEFGRLASALDLPRPRKTHGVELAPLLWLNPSRNLPWSRLGETRGAAVVLARAC